MLRQILIDQAQELKTPQEAIKPRALVPVLAELINNSKQIKVVLGIRRAGKSTLCRLALCELNPLYVNFDDERLIYLDTEGLQTLFECALELNPNCRTFFFDEIQNVDGWQLFVSRLHRTGHNLIITGSNGKLLGDDLATHLTGRHLSVTLFPLSFREYLSWVKPEYADLDTLELSTPQRAGLRKELSNYMDLGGFPSVLLGEPWRPYLQELFDRIISRDIVQRYKVREARILRELALYLIQSSGQFLSLSRMKDIFKFKSINTVQKYLQYLQSVYLVHELRGYSYKLTSRSTSPRKCFACDTGMMRSLWSKATPDHGARLETLVFLHYLRHRREIYYLRERDLEVDFCLVEDGKPTELVQVCCSLSDPKTRQREVRALCELGKKYNVRALKIISLDDEEEIAVAGQQVRVLPAHSFLLDLC